MHQKTRIIEIRTDLTEWMEVNLDEIADTKNISVLAKNICENHVLKDEDECKLDVGTTYQQVLEENIFNEVHAQKVIHLAEVQMKTNTNLSDKSKNVAWTNLPQTNKPNCINKLQIENYDKEPKVKKKLDKSFSSQIPQKLYNLRNNYRN